MSKQGIPIEITLPVELVEVIEIEADDIARSHMLPMQQKKIHNIVPIIIGVYFKLYPDPCWSADDVFKDIRPLKVARDSKRVQYRVHVSVDLYDFLKHINESLSLSGFYYMADKKESLSFVIGLVVKKFLGMKLY